MYKSLMVMLVVVMLFRDRSEATKNAVLKL